MATNEGGGDPPAAVDHSPARLTDQFYPRVVTIKTTNMCAMYCTHCLRIAHAGKRDRVYSGEAYKEALTYIRNNTRIRDVLITGDDAFVLPTNAFKRISKNVSAVLNHAVLLKGVNDTRIKMWKPCETIQESYVRPYYIFVYTLKRLAEV